MDFGMCMPAAKSAEPRTNTSFDDIVPNRDPVLPVNISRGFHYSGPDSLFFGNCIIFSLLPAAVVFSGKYLAAKLDPVFRLEATLGVALALGGLLLPFRWLSICADCAKLEIRKHFYGEKLEIPMSDIKKIKIYTESGRRGKSEFIGIKLESGKSFDLFLPKRKRIELLAFVNAHKGGTP